MMSVGSRPASAAYTVRKGSCASPSDPRCRRAEYARL
jgi:hypothetical protein